MRQKPILKYVIAGGVMLGSIGLTAFGLYDAMKPTNQSAALTSLGLAGETDWLESQKVEMEQLAKDMAQINRAIPEQLAQIDAENLSGNLEALRAKEKATFDAAVALHSLGDPEYDKLFRDLSSAERLELSNKLLRASTDLGIEADKTDAELKAVRAKIPPGGPTPLPEPRTTDISATQSELRQIFDEAGMSLK